VAANPNVLSVLEAMMGPWVQLDALTLAAFPSVEDSEMPTVSGWHRDQWSGLPRGSEFQRPLAANAITYLQDLDDLSGPLRVIPGSHRKPITLTKEEQKRPHPDERLVYMKAGDVVITHNALIHSGTPNRSGKPRYFFSGYYNLTWLRTTDDHSGPNVARIIAEARQRNDHRMLRLFGVDDHRHKRGNSGFLTPEEDSWAEWLAEDAAALAV
jgi:ectoine hydroxylase-related dioxygenase (phytanoyl-CoA dioxygenase family)